MDNDLMINEIISFPGEFHRLGNISINSFLKDIGYFKNHNQVQEENLTNALIDNPKYIDQWLVWSEDKRVSSGWYFKQRENGVYVVGYYPKNERFSEIEFDDVTNACAAFIKRAIEDVRSVK
jgi:hypothetical protein